MKVIFQVIYPATYIDKQLDSKIRKIFDHRMDGKNYMNSSSSGFGVREIESECISEHAPASVIQNIEDDLKSLFAKSVPKLKFNYFSKMNEWPKSSPPPEHLDPGYLRYRTISFKFFHKIK